MPAYCSRAAEVEFARVMQHPEHHGVKAPVVEAAHSWGYGVPALVKHVHVEAKPEKVDVIAHLK